MGIPNKPQTLFLLLLTLLCPQSPLSAQTETHQAKLRNWMGLNQSKLCQRKLSQLVLPGTHNSGASNLKTRQKRPKGDFLPPDTDSTKRSLSLSGPIYRGWSQCQNNTIKKQLNDGIRAFDLRIAKDKKGEFFCCHGLYGEKLDSVLRSIAEFSKTFPKEIILLDFAKFYTWNQSLNGQFSAKNSLSKMAHTSLITKIRQHLGKRLLAPMIKGTRGPQSTWQSTLADIWKSQRSIIVHYRHSSAKAPLWRSKIQSSWANTWNRKTMGKRLSRSLAKVSDEKFFRLNGEATPDQSLIVKSLDPFGNFPKNLRRLARETNPIFFSWILNDWRDKRLNIVQVDHYDESQLVQLCLILNKIETKNSGFKTQNSHWGQWESGASRLRNLWKRRRR